MIYSDQGSPASVHASSSLIAIKHPDKGILRAKGFAVAHWLRAQPSMVGSNSGRSSWEQVTWLHSWGGEQ